MLRGDPGHRNLEYHAALFRQFAPCYANKTAARSDKAPTYVQFPLQTFLDIVFSVVYCLLTTELLLAILLTIKKALLRKNGGLRANKMQACTLSMIMQSTVNRG